MGASLQPTDLGKHGAHAPACRSVDDESCNRLRRRLVLGACGAIVIANVRAATSKDIASVVVLDADLPEDARQDFRAEFARHGYFDGRNLKLSFKDWGGDMTALEAHARAIVASRPDLICSSYTAASLLLTRLTQDIPIVFSDATDPDRTGLVESLRVPGRNATGVSNRFLETVGKRLELLKEIRPGSRALALVIPKESRWGALMREAVALSSRRVGLAVREVPVLEKPDEKQLVQALKRTGADAFLPADVFLPPPLWIQIQTAAEMPGLFSRSAIVRAGGMLSVGPDQLDQFRRKVAIAARILRGERPSHLPVDQAAIIEIALNRKTATAFGWEVPSSVLLRLTEVVG